MGGWVAQEQGLIIRLLTLLTQKVDALRIQVKVLQEGQRDLGKGQQVLLEESTATQKELADVESDIQKILKDLAPRLAVGFNATISAVSGDNLINQLQGENNVAKKLAGATADLQITDNGAVLITVNAVDADAIPTAWPSGAANPVAAEVDPAGAPGPSFDLTKAVTTPTPTGFTVQIPVLQPPPQPLVTGIGFTVSVDSGFPGQTAPITVTVDGLADIIAGPANSFVATESAV